MKENVSLAMVTATAVAVALGGTSIAASFLPSGSVGTAQLRDQAVTNSRIANNSVGNKKLRDGSVTTQKIKDGTIRPIDFNWTVWNAIAQVPGRQGPAGMPGAAGAPGPAGVIGPMGACSAPTLLNGKGAPSSSLGSDGDFYIDTAGSILYGPRTSGVWPTPGTSMVGPEGPAGPRGDAGDPGPAGPTGPAGAAVLSGSIDPTTETGADGDFYLNTRTSTLWGPKTAGAWATSGVPLVGPQGPEGPAGGIVPSCSAQWSSSETQSADATVRPITYDTVDVAPIGGLSLVGTPPASDIRITTGGRFNLQFSAQIERMGNQARVMRIWPQTGMYSTAEASCGAWSNVLNSASTSLMATKGEREIMTGNVLLDAPDGQCVRLVQEAGAAGEFRLLAEAPTADAPGVPSIILNMWRIG
jgi:hypothetical protein